MDFIERLFHIAPDGGTGYLELSIALVCALLPGAVLLLRKAVAAGRNRSRALRASH